MGMMRLYNQGNIDQYPASLLSRCKRICDSEQFALHKYICNVYFLYVMYTFYFEIAVKWSKSRIFEKFQLDHAKNTW